MKTSLPKVAATLLLNLGMFTANAQSLSIRATANKTTQISWPSSITDLVLEETSALGPFALWQPVAQPPVLANNQYSVTLDASGGASFFRLQSPPLTTLRETSPANGETGVAVIRETIVRFTAPLGTNAVVNTNNFYAGYGGRRLLARAELSSDRAKATLFYLEPLPGSTRIYAVFDGTGLSDDMGRPLDADGDGQPGGSALIAFDTLSLTAVTGTAMTGHVYASDLMPGSDTGKNAVNRPLEGVTITVDGKEESLRTTTDAAGYFQLSPVPAGRFFVKIDGRTAKGSQWPAGAYYPYVGKAWDAVAGRTDNLAGGTGEIFLPLITAGTLQSVSPSTDTLITFPPSVVANNPALAGVTISVPANSLFGDDGTRGGKVGIAPVPANRLPGPLPPGLELPIVITVQTDGPLNFDKPAPICFPNLPDAVLGTPLPAGSKQALISFNHKKGIWEAVGSMTVSADGKFICTDPGVGILQPGWHGPAPPPLQPPPPPPGGGGPQCQPPSPSALHTMGIGLQGPCVPPDCGSITDKYYSFRRNLCLYDCTSDSDKRHAANQDLLDKMTRLMEDAGHRCVSDCNKVPGPGPGYDSCFKQCVDNVLVNLAAANKFFRIAEKNSLSQLADCNQNCSKNWPQCEINFVPSAAGSVDGIRRIGLENQPPGVDLAVFDQIEQIHNQITALIEPYLSLPSTIPPDVFTQIDSLLAQANTVAGGNSGQFLKDYVLGLEEEAVRSGIQPDEDPGNAPSYPVLYLAALQRPGGPFYLRGQTESFGQYSLFVPRDGTLLYVSFYDPRTKSYGIVLPHVKPDLPYALPRLFLAPVDNSFTDSDKDGLPDLVELIYGTDPAKADTDGDGIPDGAEVDQGTNPLDGGLVRNGIIASADTPGTAVDICAVNNLIIVADSDRGVAIFDVVDGLNPTLIAQVKTAGKAIAVACENNLVAVLDDAANLAIIDISDPSAARIVRQVGIVQQVDLKNAQAVAVAYSIAYVALVNPATVRSEIVSVEMSSGRILDRLTIERYIFDLLIGGDTLYASTDMLLALPLADGKLNVAGSAEGRGGKPLGPGLFVGGGLAYTSIGFGGSLVYNVANPNQPVFVRENPPPLPAFGNRKLVSTGSGLGIQVTGSAFPDDVSLFDLGASGTDFVFLTTFTTPGAASSVTIHNGLAYIADGEAGMQIINYLPYDTKGVPPKVSLAASFPLQRAEAFDHTNVRITANATDDVQVRNVEFYLDGVKVATDGNFPFEYRWQTPAWSRNKTSFTLRAKATDTGGNTTWTDEITVKLRDSLAPIVVKVAPDDGSAAERFSSMAAYFNQAINAATVNNASFTLTEAGPDGLFDTSDDVPVTNGAVEYRSDVSAAFLNFANGLGRGRYRARVSRNVTTPLGSPLENDKTWQFDVLGKTTIQGLVQFEDGKPAVGADVTPIELQVSVTTDANGRFSLPDLILPVQPRPTLAISFPIPGGSLVAGLTLSSLVDRGITDEGTITLHPLCDAKLVAATFPNGDLESGVNAFATFNDGTGPALYAGGPFGVAKWAGIGWQPLGAFAEATPGSGILVNALAVFDDGTGPALYAAGKFASSGGVTLNNIAKWNGTIWTSVGGGVTTSSGVAKVFALAVFNDGTGPALYVSGAFDKAGNVPAVLSFVKWNGKEWAALDNVYVGSQALTVFDDGTGPALYAGDSKWDGTQFSRLGNGVNGLVSSMAGFNDGSGPVLYVGGTFTTAGGVPANNIAKWDGSKWMALGSGTDRPVTSLAVFNDGTGPALFVAGGIAGFGGFHKAGGIDVANLAQWKDGAWSAIDRKAPDPNNPAGVSDAVGALAVFDDGKGARLYVGGSFRGATSGNNIVPAQFAASWNGTAWAPVGQGLSGGTGDNGGLLADRVKALTEFKDSTGDALYVGGHFTYAGTHPANSIAKWDGNQFLPLGTGMAGDVTKGEKAEGEVDALAVFDDGTGAALYAGGLFETAGHVAVKSIAKWNGTAWSALGSGLSGSNPGRANALIAFNDGTGTALFVGGQFESAGGIAAANLAKWSGKDWSALGGGLAGQVFALAVFDDGNGPALYAGGDIAQLVAGGAPIVGIAKWTGSDWISVGSGLLGGPVQTLTVFNDGTGPALYAGGRFFRTGNGKTKLYGVAKWDGKAWLSVGSTINAPDGGSVNALLGFDDGTGPALYGCCGLDLSGGGGPGDSLAKWDGRNWTSLSSDANCSACLEVNAMGVFNSGEGNALFLGGSFERTGAFGSVVSLAKWYRPAPPCVGR